MKFDIERFKELETPFYYYDMDLLRDTIAYIQKCIKGHPVHVHYAIKANANPAILRAISAAGFSADCVSGNEVRTAIENGFSPDRIFFAGVGKTDREINYAISVGIGCFNIESVEEMEVIADLAAKAGKRVPVSLRVNPNVDAHTHKYITTGLNENKFGISMDRLDETVDKALSYPSLELIGLHFHIGSQITETEPFLMLCNRVNELLKGFSARGINFRVIDMGGGLGIDYDDPQGCPIPDFKSYFNTIFNNLRIEPGQEIHVEPGRSIVGQCGALISEVVFVKKGVNRKFVILDAGFTELIRPALYGAHHKMLNLTAKDDSKTETYDVVGPICESSDCFGTDEVLPETHRGDLIALLSAGAYGEVMASCYNCRDLVKSYNSDQK